jgi:hypothetical protein
MRFSAERMICEVPVCTVWLIFIVAPPAGAVSPPHPAD